MVFPECDESPWHTPKSSKSDIDKEKGAAFFVNITFTALRCVRWGRPVLRAYHRVGHPADCRDILFLVRPEDRRLDR